jgi:hypothetical protein
MKFTGVKLSGVKTKYVEEYVALLDYAVSQSIPLPNAAQRARDSAGIIYAKAQGIWTEADVWYKFRSNGSYHVDFACLNWKNPGTFTLQRFNSPTFGANGFTGNGTNMYLTSGWHRQVSGNNYILNNAGVLSYTDNNQNLNDVTYGMRDGGTVSNLFFNPLNPSNQVNSRINQATSHQPSNSNSIGFWHQKRTGASASAVFKNGTSIGTSSITSTSLNNAFLALLALNTDGTIGSFSNKNLSLLIVGSSFNTKESAAYTWFNNYVA